MTNNTMDELKMSLQRKRFDQLDQEIARLVRNIESAESSGDHDRIIRTTRTLMGFNEEHGLEYHQLERFFRPL